MTNIFQRLWLAVCFFAWLGFAPVGVVHAKPEFPTSGAAKAFNFASSEFGSILLSDSVQNTVPFIDHSLKALTCGAALENTFPLLYTQDCIAGHKSLGQETSAFLPRSGPSTTVPNSTNPKPRVASSLLELPIHFEGPENESTFTARGVGYKLLLTRSEVSVHLRSDDSKDVKSQYATLRLSSPGANLSTPIGESEMPGKANYLVGQDPAHWKTNIPLFAKVRYRDVYDGIDRVFYGKQSELEYDWIVSPGADPQQIREVITGADELSIDAAGDLVIRVGSASIRHRRPFAYQEINGEQAPVNAEYLLASNGEIQFKVAEYDKSRALIIDPILSYATFLGVNETPYAATLDALGNLYVAGAVRAGDLLTQNPYQPVGGGMIDAFVLKLNPSGTAMVYATYIGGAKDDWANAIAVDSAGSVYITGDTESANYPTLNAIYSTPLSRTAAFITKLNPGGNGLVYSTLLTGNPNAAGTTADYGKGIVVDFAGNAFITGEAQSADFPVSAGAYSAVGGAFVTKLSPLGGMIYSTRLTGTAWGSAIALDGSGNAYVHGVTYATDMPLVNPAQSVMAGYYSTFIAKLDLAGTSLVYSTYLGGTWADTSRGITVDSSGHVWVTGNSQSDDFPNATVSNTLFSKQPSFMNNGALYRPNDVYVAKMSTDGATVEALIWLTGTFCWTGGCGLSSISTPTSIAMDASGNAYVSGRTDGWGSTFPQVNAIPLSDPTTHTLGFLTKILPSGRGLAYSTLVSAFNNGTHYDFPLALSSAGDAYLIGLGAPGFPATPGVYMPTTARYWDAFAVKILSSGDTSVLLTSSKTPATVGDVITLTAVVSGRGPTGTLTFKNGPTILGTVPLPISGTATILVTPTVGTHFLTATYSGDSSNPSSDSSVLAQTVYPPPGATLTTISANDTSFPLNGSVRFTAYVSGASTPTGSVTFKDGAIILGTATLSNGVASLTTNTLPAGTHSVIAEYQGNILNRPSTSLAVVVTVSGPPSITIIAPLHGATYAATDPINFAVTVVPDGLTTITNVELRVNGSTIATFTTPPFTFSLAQAPPGNYSLVAVAWDAFRQSSTSLPTLYTVLPLIGNGSITTYFHHDLSGNTIAATDAVGSVVYTEQYRPYGERLVNDSTSQSAQANGNSIWFHGKVQDEATGLQYFGARYYDPVIGRFMGVDPVGFDPANLHSANRYAYGNNNPYKYRDPDGRAAIALLPFVPEISAAVWAGIVKGTALVTGAVAAWYGNKVLNEEHGEKGDDAGAKKPADGADSGTNGADSAGKKQRNKPPEPLPEAEGRPHSIVERPGKDGQYTTHNGDGTSKQYRGSGKDHGNIPRPNVKEIGKNITPDGREFIDKGRVRPPRQNEIPKG